MQEALASTMERVKRSEGETSDLKTKVDVVAAKLDTTNQWLQIVGIVFGLVSFVGLLASSYAFYRSETRAQEAHKFAIETGVASQARQAQVHDNFLGGSRETLELVNSTLGLAKDASERAAKIIERRVRKISEDLQNESKTLLSSVPKDDDRQLFTSAEKRSKLQTLAQKIAGFDQYRALLSEDIDLAPTARFILGMNYHLEQNFDEAINSWREVANSSEAGNSLRSFAWYWIGYEQNNINRFEAAEQSFSRSLEFAEDELRKYELRRILYETKFFRAKDEDVRRLVEPFEDLLRQISAEQEKDKFARCRARIAVTTANVLGQAARAARVLDDSPGSRELFNKARVIFEDAAKVDLWARFGLAQVKSALGDKDGAISLYKSVREQADQERRRRQEPRSRVLAGFTELICCLEVREPREDVDSVRKLVEEDLSHVDSRVTIYSQLNKRNVPKEEFEKHMTSVCSRIKSEVA